MNKTLSIFCDESGDMGNYSKHSPYYLITLVFHDQSIDLTDKITQLDKNLDYFGYSNHLIHTGPLIRREEPFKNMDNNDRKTLLTRLYYFMIKSEISYKTFIYKKYEFDDIFKLESKMNKDITSFINAQKLFKEFDNFILYYDYGQHSITRIMNLIMSNCFSKHEIRKINPYDYKLFQVADLVCTLELINEKIKTRELTKSEKYIFHSKSDFKKDFYKKYSQGILK